MSSSVGKCGDQRTQLRQPLRRYPVSPPRAFLSNLFSSGEKDDEIVIDQSTVNPVVQPGKKLRDYTEVAYLTGRARLVGQHFPTALGIDDFLHRLEIALFAYGFNGDNSIAMVNLCRDEITVSLKNKIDHVFGSSFNTNGLGGVLTCGVTGVAAGLSRARLERVRKRTIRILLFSTHFCRCTWRNRYNIKAWEAWHVVCLWSIE